MRSSNLQSGLDKLDACLTELTRADPVAAPDEQLRADLVGLLRAFNQLAGIIAGVVDSFDARGLSEVDAVRTTRTWLTAFGRMSQGAAAGWLSQARLLRELPALAQASRDGTVSTEHVHKVADLAKKVGVAAVRDFDSILTDLATQSKPAEVGAACERIRAHVDPDGPPPDPQAAFERRNLTIARCGSMFAVRGQLDPEGAAALMTALDAVMKPPKADDLRTAAQRRADAMIELTRLGLTAGHLPTVGGVRPQLGILITPQALLGIRPETLTDANTTGQTPLAAADHDTASDGHGGPDHHGASDNHAVLRAPRTTGDPLSHAGVPLLPEPPWMNWVGEIPTELAQRISCDCEIWRAVLDPATGLPLEVGRGHRVVPSWIRKALQARDRGCRWPGCEAPTAWTDAHHLIGWYYGGRTDVDNLLLLCRYHHARVHEGRWRLVLDPKTGEVTVHRPDGRLYELGPSRPWTGANRHPDNVQPPHRKAA